VEASPEAEVRWYYLGVNSTEPGVELNTSDGRRIENFRNGILVIHALKRSDTGFYKCEAVNPLGAHDATMHLRVKGKEQKLPVCISSSTVAISSL